MSKKVMAVVAVVALVAILGICLVACNAESIQKKLEKADYTCTSYEADYVTVTKFANTDDAKEYESSVPTASVGGIKLVVKRIGKVCYYGTEQGVKDAQ